jgi:hypothetical protein
MAASDLKGGHQLEKSVVDKVAKTLVDQASNVGESWYRCLTEIFWRSSVAVIICDPLAFNVGVKAENASGQLALFVRLRTANRATEVQRAMSIVKIYRRSAG